MKSIKRLKTKDLAVQLMALNMQLIESDPVLTIIDSSENRLLKIKKTNAGIEISIYEAYKL